MGSGFRRAQKHPAIGDTAHRERCGVADAQATVPQQEDKRLNALRVHLAHAAAVVSVSVVASVEQVSHFVALKGQRGPLLALWGVKVEGGIVYEVFRAHKKSEEGAQLFELLPGRDIAVFPSRPEIPEPVEVKLFDVAKAELACESRHLPA
jgi:hypothetical protein